MVSELSIIFIITPPPPMVIVRAVRIPLECILVLIIIQQERVPEDTYQRLQQ